MKVVIGCECSGQMRRAFMARGHWCISIDLQPADDDMPRSMNGGHIIGDLFEEFDRLPWEPDLCIVHPDCTYLTCSGLHWNTKRPERAAQTERALEFVARCWALPVKCLALENPQGCINTRLPFMPRPQYVQPYQFGDDASKKTGWWTRGLPPLVIDPAKFFPPRLVCDICQRSFGYGMHKCPNCGSHSYKPRWGNQTNSGQNKLAPSEGRAKQRAETYSGMAAAIADQWGRL